MRAPTIRHPAALAAFLLVLILFPVAARAHAVLLETAPADGQALAAAPETFTLHFNEPVRVVSLRLLRGDGRSVPLEPVAGAAPEYMTAPLPALGPGSYIVSWRMISDDGHPIVGSSVFAVGAGDTAWAAGARAAADVPASLWLGYDIARFLVYAATLTAAGAALFLVLFGQLPATAAASVRPFAAGAAIAGMAATLAALALETAILEGSGIAGGLAALAGGLPPGVGMAPLLRLAGLLLVGIGVLVRFLLPAFGVTGALLASASFALTGHTVPYASIWLSALLVLHLLAGAFWIGSFWPLIRATRCPDAEAVRRLMKEFSGVAMVLVPALALAGSGLALALVGDWRALATTDYGRTLALKVLLVGGMLVLAALNKWRFVPRIGRERGAMARLRRSIGIEMGLGGLVLAATVALTGVHPPASGSSGSWLMSVLHPGRAVSATVDSSEGPLSVALTVTPALPGENAFEVEVLSAEGGPRDIPEATLKLSRPDLGVERISRPLERIAPGRYRYVGTEMAVPGAWTVEVDLLVSDFEKRTVAFDLPVGAGHEDHAF